jgi:hypothetical protein
LRHKLLLSVVLAASATPAATLAAPELPVIPDLGQSGQDVTLPDVVADHYPPDVPAGPPDSAASFSTPEIPGPPFETPVGPPDGVPPDPETPADGDHPLGGAPPFGLGKPATVPEPGTFALLAAGLAGLVVAGRRRA